MFTVMTPLVSIIIPTFNRANIISETLDSVLGQTYENWECIVVDDGSTDTSKALLKTYVDKDARFQFHQRPNSHLAGGNGARNYGFSKSCGDYIQWFDSDDIMMPDFIGAKMSPFISNPNIDVVFSAFENIDATGQRTRIANQTFSGNILNDLVDGQVSFGPLSFMLRRDKIEHLKYDETLKKNQDLDFFFRFFTSNNKLKIAHVKKTLYKVRAHSGSMTYDASRDISKLASIFRVYLMVLNYFVEQKHSKGIIRYKYECLNSLKVMSRNGYYREVMNRLLAFPYLHIGQKVYLMCCVLSQFLFNRGANRFVSVDFINQ